MKMALVTAKSANRGSQKTPTTLQSVILLPKRRAAELFVLVAALPMGLRVLSVPRVARRAQGRHRMIASCVRQVHSHLTELAFRPIRMEFAKGQV